MEISEQKLKEEYTKYQEEKTETIRNIFGVINLIISAIGGYISFSTIGFYAILWFLVSAIVFGMIFSVPIYLYKKSVCLSYEKWSVQYLQRNNLMQSYNQSASTFSNKNTYDTSILPYTIRAKITELQNQIDSNEIVNRTLPMLEKLLRQRVLVTAQKQLIDLEIQKIPLYQQDRENQVFTALIAQKNDKQKTINNIESQINRLQ